MGDLVAGYASSHAFTFLEPTEWDDFRELIREGYRKRHGTLPPINPHIEDETLEANQIRFQNIRLALDRIKEELAADPPDALILIGDDQDENFDPDYLVPQLAIYTGPDFHIRGGRSLFESRQKNYPNLQFRSHQSLAEGLLAYSIDQGFDMSVVSSVPDNTLVSHAHFQILEELVGQTDIPVVLVFLNALHQPAPTPARCFELGKMIRDFIESSADNQRISVFGSGGLSHFTAGYPWSVYEGSFQFGDIAVDFDEKVVEDMRTGAGEKLSKLTSEDLLSTGNIELRSWIAVMGAVDGTKADFVEYEAFYRGIQGMAVGSWKP